MAKPRRDPRGRFIQRADSYLARGSYIVRGSDGSISTRLYQVTVGNPSKRSVERAVRELAQPSISRYAPDGEIVKFNHGRPIPRNLGGL